MILWRHLDDQKERWVYHPTQADAANELRRMSVVNCANQTSRRFYAYHRKLEKCEVWQPASKQAMAEVMNLVEQGKDIQWLMS